MDLGLTGKKAIVTGGSLGIGYAIAVDLVNEGVDVVITARDGGRLDVAAKSIRGPGRCMGVAGDLGVNGDLNRVIDSATEALGGRLIFSSTMLARPRWEGLRIRPMRCG